MCKSFTCCTNDAYKEKTRSRATIDNYVWKIGKTLAIYNINKLYMILAIANVQSVVYCAIGKNIPIHFLG